MSYYTLERYDNCKVGAGQRYHSSNTIITKSEVRCNQRCHSSKGRRRVRVLGGESGLGSVGVDVLSYLVVIGVLSVNTNSDEQWNLIKPNNCDKNIEYDNYATGKWIIIVDARSLFFPFKPHTAPPRVSSLHFHASFLHFHTSSTCVTVCVRHLLGQNVDPTETKQGPGQEMEVCC
ncbi:hypothetical protein Pcinc_042543 [Petrolisthes cinctipes]|uniref:Uncharacterized protein n=1 Tax=Petrolisthes cinctipes TaxID=88211 RepID=A0AAE1EIQ0_PETCI|nr:hypothetical protein Pcinc_042543 [Petrolisthes cinctipes]